MTLLGTTEAAAESLVPGGTLLPVLLKLLPWALLAGASGLAIHFDERAVSNADRVKTQAAQFKQAQLDADAAWAAKLEETKVEQAKDASNAQASFTAALGTVKALTSAYGNTHPAVSVLNTPAPSASSAPEGTAQAASTAVPAGLPSNSFVAISPADLQTCGDLAPYALKAREWALSVGEVKALEQKAPGSFLTGPNWQPVTSPLTPRK